MRFMMIVIETRPITELEDFGPEVAKLANEPGIRPSGG